MTSKAQSSYITGLHSCSKKLAFSAYDNAVQDDLWNALEKQAANDEIILPATVKEIMDSWTLKKNYPVVTIIRDYGESDGATAIQVSIMI